jgi:mevalonate kinase
MNFSTRANGKLLLTAEYFVTEGATALALPTRLGQRLSAGPGTAEGQLEWKSYDHEGQSWFEASFSLDDFEVKAYSDHDDAAEVASQLQELLQTARQLNPNFLKDSEEGILVETHLEFPRNWGLGSSSTLVSMLAEWAEVNPYELLDNTMEGSGYDIAAAKANGPMLFRRFNGRPQSDSSRFNPSFKHQLYFVHLNEKQSSKEALVYYKITPPEQREQPMGRITQITHDIAQYTKDLDSLNELIAEHEELVKSVIQQERAKDLYFSDYWGEVKSLGAWGGDFVLVTSNEPEDKTRAYFAERGFETVLTYDEMVL